jgi:hypothetical protein
MSRQPANVLSVFMTDLNKYWQIPAKEAKTFHTPLEMNLAAYILIISIPDSLSAEFTPGGASTEREARRQRKTG